MRITDRRVECVDMADERLQVINRRQQRIRIENIRLKRMVCELQNNLLPLEHFNRSLERGMKHGRNPISSRNR